MGRIGSAIAALKSFGPLGTYPPNELERTPPKTNCIDLNVPRGTNNISHGSSGSLLPDSVLVEIASYDSTKKL
eukprot:1777638-Rhodomonas_salina.1